jgi:hypothetical protein
MGSTHSGDVKEQLLAPNPYPHQLSGKPFYTVMALAGLMAEADLPSKAIRFLSILLIIGGVAFYLVWGIAFGSWNFFESRFVPVYAIFIVMVAFGGLGLLLLKNKD